MKGGLVKGGSMGRGNSRSGWGNAGWGEQVKGGMGGGKHQCRRGTIQQGRE